MEQPCKVYKNPPLIVVSLDGVTSSKSDDSGKVYHHLFLENLSLNCVN